MRPSLSSYNWHQFNLLGSNLALRIHSESPVGPDCARNTKNLKQISILSSIVDHNWIPKATKSGTCFEHFLKPSPERFFRASGLYFESFWPPFWILFGTRGEKWKLCYRCRVNPPERVWEGHLFDMFLHFFQHTLLTRFLHSFFTIFAAFGQPFWTLWATFSTLLFKHDFKTLKVHKKCARMVSPIGGPTSKLVVYLPLSDSPPLILSLKGTLFVETSSCLHEQALSRIYTCRGKGTGKRRWEREWKRVKRAQRREEARIVKRQTCFCVFVYYYVLLFCLVGLVWDSN